MSTLSYSFTKWGWWTANVSLVYTISYDAATNRSTVSFDRCLHNYTGRKGYSSSAVTTILVSAGDNPSSAASASFSTSGNTYPSGYNYLAVPSPAAIVVQHSPGPGAKTVTIAGSTEISAYPNENYGVSQTNGGAGSRTETSHTIPYASTIAGCTAGAQTLGAIQLTMNRYDASYQHVATFSCGGTTLAVSERFDTGLSQSVPRAWFDGFPNAASLTVTVSVQTYSGSTALGSPATATVAVTADAGMAPTLESGFAAAAPENSGTAAAAISGYVQGLSRARLTLDRSKVTTANNAAVASYTVSCQGADTTLSSPVASETVDTAVLSGSGDVTITVTATDSRGLSASVSVPISIMAYAPPTISGAAVFRCTADGTASADGTCYSAKATAGCSGLNGQNSASLSVRAAQGSGSYGSPTALTSGTAQVVSAGLDPDQRAAVKLTVTDALGGSSETVVTLPGRKWAMKFRADGQGVAFGKVPEHGQKKLELPADWEILFGATTLAARIGAARPTLYRRTFAATTDGTGNVVLGAAFDDRLIVNLRTGTPLIAWTLGSATGDGSNKMLHFTDYTGAAKANASVTFTLFWFEESDFTTQQVT